LIHLEENSTKITNKFSKDIQARNLELSIQSCLWLCRKNQAALTESEEAARDLRSEEKTQRGGKEVFRSQTTAFAFVKPKAKDRFERKKTSDLRLRKSYLARGSTNTTPKESSLTSELSSEEEKQNKTKFPSAVKKTGRGRPRKGTFKNKAVAKRALTTKIKSHIKLRSKKYK
jgi:hypothetical protein